MQTQYDLVKVEGLRGAKYAVRKRVKGFLFRGEYFLCVDDGIPVGYSEEMSNAWYGSKKQAEKLLKIES